MIDTSQLMKKSSLILALSIIALSACSSDSGSNNDALLNAIELPPTSDEGGDIGVFNPLATRDVFACEAPYYLGLRGLYLGTASYTAPDDTVETCTWDTTLQVRGNYENEEDTSSCLVSATYAYTLIEGASSCVEGAVDGVMDDPLAASSNRLDWADPQWPLDLIMTLEIEPSEEDAIFPVGTQSAANLEVHWSFDGQDEVLLIDDDSTDGTVDAFLVER